MKKVCLILGVMLSLVSVSNFIMGGDDSSGKSLFTSIYIMFLPLEVSAGSSDESGRNRVKTVEENYEYHKKIMEAGNLTAKDIFSEELIKKFGLNENDKIDLSEIKLGIIVSDKTKVLAFIPAKQEYAELMDSNKRNIK